MQADFDWQTSQRLKVDGKLYLSLDNDKQKSPELAKSALQGGLQICLIHRTLLRNLDFYKENYEFIQRDNSWYSAYFFLPQPVQRTESVMIDMILHNIHDIPLVNLCAPHYVLNIQEPGWIKIFAKYHYDQIPHSQKWNIHFHVVIRLKRYLKNYYHMALAANVLVRCWKKSALSKLPLDALRNVTTFLISENYSEMRRAMQNIATVTFPAAWKLDDL